MTLIFLGLKVFTQAGDVNGLIHYELKDCAAVLICTFVSDFVDIDTMYLAAMLPT